MGLSLEGFGGEFEVGKMAFELEDLEKGKKEEEKEGNRRIFLFRNRFRPFGGDIYIYVRKEILSRGGFLGLLWARRTRTDRNEFREDWGEKEKGVNKQQRISEDF